MLRTQNTYQFFKRRNGQKLVLRSRLEAKWAYFFDSLNMSWTYEPTIIEYQGIRYIPDFYVSDIGFIEIKPSFELLKDESFFKLKSSAISLSKQGSSNKLYSICSAQPTLGSKHPSRSIIKWTENGIKPIAMNEFVYLLAKASEEISKRSYPHSLEILRYFIKRSEFIKQQPTPIKYSFSKLIMEFSNNSHNEVSFWELDSVLQRKTLSNIINGLATDLEFEKQKLYQFYA